MTRSDDESPQSSRSYLLGDQVIQDREKLRLQIQARALFSIEITVLEALGLANGLRVVDIGCGTGAYLSFLAERYPEVRFLGIDRNEVLLCDARALLGDVQLVKTDITDPVSLGRTIESFSPDRVLMRFVAQHLTRNERECVFKAILSAVKPGTKIFLVEPDDREIHYSPPSKDLKALIERAIHWQGERGGSRTLGGELGPELKINGWNAVDVRRVEVGSQALGWEICRSIYLPVWSSGISTTPSCQEGEWLRGVEGWMDSGSHNPSATLSFPLFITAAEK